MLQLVVTCSKLLQVANLRKLTGKLLQVRKCLLQKSNVSKIEFRIILISINQAISCA